VNAQAAPFRQLRASAGSGKTYALTLRFLELLAGTSDEDIHIACAGAKDLLRSYTWPEILAVTFTNKAAAEMRQRVLGALKRRALGEDDGPGHELSPQRAEALLQDILRHTQHLGIRTIDSLLGLLVRLFALDQGLKPDFDTVFDEAEALSELYDRFLVRCETGGAEAALFQQAVRTMIEHEEKAGFWLADDLRKRLVELARMLLVDYHDEELCTDQKRMADLLAVSYGDMRAALDRLRRDIESVNLECAKNFTGCLDKCDAAELFGGLPDSAYLAKDSLSACLLKKSQPRCTPGAEAAYSAFKVAAAAYARDLALIKPAYGLAPCVDIARTLLADLRAMQRDKGFLFGSQMAAIVGRTLDADMGVPDAFCRLGDRLHHLLVDEFQDTSRAQWAATLPLASECLSKGGSLFCVGDVKQAIYGWRGGDARLFDEIAADDELCAMSGGAEQGSLPHNWRSLPEIVAFNNRVFGALGDPGMAEDIATTLLPGAPEDLAEDFAARLNAAFADAEQQIPDKKSGGEPGRVQVRLLPASRAEEAVDAGLDAMVDALKNDILPRRRLGDVAVLVRSGAHSDLVCQRLVNEGWAIITENSLLLARHPVVRQLVALLRLLDAPPDDTTLMEFLCGRELFLDESGIALSTILDWAARDAKGGLLKRFRDDFPAEYARLLAPFLKQTGLLRPYDIVQAALAAFQVPGRHPEAELYVRRFLEVVHTAEAQGLGSLARFLEYWSQAGADEKVPLPEAADAIRVLTVHKAKGLQFPVCIIPLHNWSSGARGEYRVAEILGHRMFTKLSKDLGRPYYEQQAETLLEQANLLYVAWTRAEEELFAFVPDTDGKRNLGAAPVLLRMLLDIPREEAGLELGRPPAGSTHAAPKPASPKEIPPRETPPQFLTWLPRLRVFRHSVEDAGVDSRTRGKLAHKAVELLRPSGDDKTDIERAATLAAAEFPELRALPEAERHNMLDEVRGMLGWLLAMPEARPHLGHAGHAGSELTILTPDGEFLRPDLLRFTPDGPMVLEFKTGHAEPAHAAQLREYLGLAAAMPEALGREPRGMLVYLDRRVVEPVTLGGGRP
jgi:ATP-dependent exoDNAse (exonuclease V) beta subunit